MAVDSLILTEIQGRVGLLKLNRPEVKNALNAALLTAMMDGLAEFDRTDSIGAVVITGSELAFAAGMDIKEINEATPVSLLRYDPVALFDRIRTIHKPVIAAVSGWCLGGGCELSLACDMIVASETARFGQPEINLGVIPGAGGTQHLARSVGKVIAMEMILNNRILTAQEALQFGMVNRVVPVERYLAEALSLAADIAVRAPLALRMAKEAINNAFETSLSDGILDERRAFHLLFASHDQKEGMAAFIEKRKAEWKGE